MSVNPEEVWEWINGAYGELYAARCVLDSASLMLETAAHKLEQLSEVVQLDLFVPESAGGGD